MIAAACFVSCHTVDDDRVPVMPVQITFISQAQWDVYGVAAAMDYRSFIRDERVPAGYHYTASTYTGFGGVLLVSDVLGNPQAYDLACPVECRRDVRVKINEDDYKAFCPKCGSTYDVFSLSGTPVSGVAAERGYGLRRYRVSPGRDLSAYMIIYQ